MRVSTESVPTCYCGQCQFVDNDWYVTKINRPAGALKAGSFCWNCGDRLLCNGKTESWPDAYFEHEERNTGATICVQCRHHKPACPLHYCKAFPLPDLTDFVTGITQTGRYDYCDKHNTNGNCKMYEEAE